MATQMAYYPSPSSSMNSSPFQSRHTGASTGSPMSGTYPVAAGVPRPPPGSDPSRQPPIPPGRHMFHPFNRPYPKPGQDRSDYDSKQLRKSSMRKTVDYYASVIRMLEVSKYSKYLFDKKCTCHLSIKTIHRLEHGRETFVIAVA